MEKVSLYKFIHTPLLKNDGQLKQKSDKQPQKKEKKEAITQFIKKKKKIMSQKNKKKPCLVKPKKKNYPTHSPGNQKKEKKGKEQDMATFVH